MNLLLDTHVFIWATANPDRLSEKVMKLLYDINHEWLLRISIPPVPPLVRGLGGSNLEIAHRAPN